MKNVKLTFDLDNPKMKPSRDGYGDGLNDAAAKNPDVVAIGADITASTRVDWFVKEHPDRFYDLGIAEQNQMAFAAGMSLMGKVPFVCNYGVFLAGRAWDQIRTTVCYNNLNVKLGGAHGGISVGGRCPRRHLSRSGRSDPPGAGRDLHHEMPSQHEGHCSRRLLGDPQGNPRSR